MLSPPKPLDEIQPNSIYVTHINGARNVRRDFYSVAWVMPQGWDFGALVSQGVKKCFKHGHVAYQIDGDDEQDRMQVTFSSYDQTGDLGARSKGQSK